MTFDCYGTLIDWERGIGDAMSGIWPHVEAKDLIAAYHDAEPVVQRSSSASYRSVLASTLAQVAEARSLPLADDRRDVLAETLPEWPPFPEVAAELAAVKHAGWKVAILSNTDPALLEASVKRIGVEPDLMVTVAEAGSYKPARGHWDRFFEETKAEKSLHVHVAASLFHDIAPAADLGLNAVWINRRADTTDLPVAAELPTLAGLASVLDEVVPP